MSTLDTSKIANLTIDAWRCYKMSKSTMNIAKGIGAGVAAGMVVGYIGSKYYNDNSKKIKKKANKAASTVGGILENVAHMMK